MGVHELERLLGKKTLEAAILREALEPTRSKKKLLRSSWPGPRASSDETGCRALPLPIGNSRQP